MTSRTADKDLWLIRHGESTWNADGRWQGHCDAPLSELGRAQVSALAAGLEPGDIDVLVSSDLERALETARAVGAVVGVPPRPDPAFRELDLGEWGGLVRPQIQARWPDLLRRFDAEEPTARPAGGETRLELAARVRSATARLLDAHPGRRVAIVAHYGAIEALVPGIWLENAEVYKLSRAEVVLR